LTHVSDTAAAVKPLALGPNLLRRFYRGGEAIARFRGIAHSDEHAPEDWVASTTTVFGEDDTGLSVLPDGSLLRDAVAADPDGFLGSAHAGRYGADPALLVKLLDAGERLPVHCHPGREFARARLDSAYGKTEAWVIVEARGERPSVHLGFRADVDAETLAGWVERQDREPLLEAMHEIPVAPGDCLFVPAGVPHAIGEGILLVELQEPSDLSVLLEWEGFSVEGARDGHLGLGFETALDCVVRTGLDPEELARWKRTGERAPDVRPGVRSLLPSEADPYFRAEWLQPDPDVSLEPAFSILVVLDGTGTLETENGGMLVLARGQTVLIPHGAGAARLTGALQVVRCLPPRMK
jgi:mannose-6-phosphate isomerase